VLERKFNEIAQLLIIPVILSIIAIGLSIAIIFFVRSVGQTITARPTVVPEESKSTLSSQLDKLNGHISKIGQSIKELGVKLSGIKSLYEYDIQRRLSDIERNLNVLSGMRNDILKEVRQVRSDLNETVRRLSNVIEPAVNNISLTRNNLQELQASLSQNIANINGRLQEIDKSLKYIYEVIKYSEENIRRESELLKKTVEQKFRSIKEDIEMRRRERLDVAFWAKLYKHALSKYRSAEKVSSTRERYALLLQTLSILIFLEESLRDKEIVSRCRSLAVLGIRYSGDLDSTL